MAKSFRGSANSLVNQFVTLSQNSSDANGTLGTILINDQHKYLLLKYFDNERTVNMSTVGGGTLATLASFASGATSGTLSTAWPNISAQQLTVFSNSQQRNVQFIQNATKITWTPALSSAASGSTIATSGVQFYPLPANVSKIKNDTITIGQLVYTPAPVQSIQEWTKLNALPYTSDIPAYFYIYNNQVGFWPIPSSSGNVISLNCQINFADMSYSDYSTGTIAANGVSVGSNIVTGTSTAWTAFPTNVDLTFANLFFKIDPPTGDGLQYQIQSFSSATTATLIKPIVNVPSTSAATYTIGQYPLLSPDFHDAIVYGALRIYFSSIVKDNDRFQLYTNLFKEKTDLMSFYLATKSVNVDLGQPVLQANPNLYWNGNSNQ